MPGFDKTGPNGQGAQTGRARGLCSSNNTVSNFYGRRNGNGRGIGRGFGFRNYQGNDKDLLAQEKQVLEDRIKHIDEKLSK